jgi:hypothetical protein
MLFLTRWKSGFIASRIAISAALTIAFGLGACSLITAPLPPNAEPFAPPAVFARWWAMTEACSGTSGDLAAVRWYRVPGSRFIFRGQPVAGYWNSSTNRIVLAEDVIEQGDMVRHEMLHALLRRPVHPRSEFLGSCASLVSCQGICTKDDGTWQLPRPDYVVLPPNSLAVSARAELLPQEADGQRWFALEVNVQNAGARAVLVAAPGDRATPHTFGYDLRGPSGGIGGGEIESDSSTLFFEPFETKKWLFEFLVSSDLSENHITPGAYLVRVDYARQGSAGTTIAISP